MNKDIITAPVPYGGIVLFNNFIYLFESEYPDFTDMQLLLLYATVNYSS